MKRLILAAISVAAFATAQANNPQLGFNELAANQAQPHITINSADRSITQAIAGSITINFASNANLTLTSSQWAYATIVLTDTGPVLSAGRDVIYPNVDSLTGGSSRLRFAVKNATAQTLTIKRSGQTGVAVAAGSIALLQHNGTDIEAVSGGGGGGTVDLTTDVTGILPGSHGGTNNAFMQFSGPTTSTKTFTLPNASSTILTSNAAVTFGQGGTGLASASDDTTLVSTGSAWAALALPDCDDTGGNHLNYDTSTNAYSCGTSGGGGGGSPGGSNTQVQYNASGSFGGDADWTWDASTNLMTIGSVATPATLRGFTQSGTTGNGGAITFAAGNAGSSSGTGGTLTLKGGDAASGGSQGGNVVVQLGDGGSVDGSFQVLNPGGQVKFAAYPTGIININNDFGAGGAVLTSAGTGSPAAWGPVSLSNSNAVTGALPWANVAKPPFRTVTSTPDFLSTADYSICVNLSVAGPSALTLPSSPATGAAAEISDCKGDANTNNITISPASGQIDGSSTLVINTAWGSATMRYTGSRWKVIAVR